MPLAHSTSARAAALAAWRAPRTPQADRRLAAHAAGFIAIVTSLSLPLMGAPIPKSVTVNAGPFERRNITISFAWPDADATPRNAGLVRTRPGQRDQIFPLQFNDGQAAATLDHLAKGSREVLVVARDLPALTTTAAGDLIVAERHGNRLDFTRRAGDPAAPTASRQPLFSYQAEPGEFPRPDIKGAFRRGGYLHPIFAPGGQRITDDFPPNHVHHHGVWSAWTHTEFQGRQPDFWNMGDLKGRVEFVALDANWSGSVHAGLRARHRFVDLTAQPPVTALHETWTVTAYVTPADARGTWHFDLTSAQRCAAATPLRLPEYRYGGIGLRGNPAWNGPTNAQFLTANGESDRLKGHATRARWCDLSGLVDGRRVGIAVLGHPSNYRFPEPMRIHPDEPFFNFAPQQAGDMEIKPGETYTTRYRFVVHDGAPDPDTIERLWNDFATPPQCTANF